MIALDGELFGGPLPLRWNRRQNAWNEVGDRAQGAGSTVDLCPRCSVPDRGARRTRDGRRGFLPAVRRAVRHECSVNRSIPPRFIALQPLPRLRRMPLRNNAGGFGTPGAECCAKRGVRACYVWPATCAEQIEELLPGTVSLRNPIDLVAAVMRAYVSRRSCRGCSSDPDVDVATRVRDIDGGGRSRRGARCPLFPRPRRTSASRRRRGDGRYGIDLPSSGARLFRLSGGRLIGSWAPPRASRNVAAFVYRAELRTPRSTACGPRPSSPRTRRGWRGRARHRVGICCPETAHGIPTAALLVAVHRNLRLSRLPRRSGPPVVAVDGRGRGSQDQVRRRRPRRADARSSLRRRRRRRGFLWLIQVPLWLGGVGGVMVGARRQGRGVRAGRGVLGMGGYAGVELLGEMRVRTGAVDRTSTPTSLSRSARLGGSWAAARPSARRDGGARGARPAAWRARDRLTEIVELDLQGVVPRPDAKIAVDARTRVGGRTSAGAPKTWRPSQKGRQS